MTTVKQLIELLQTQDPNMRVITSGYEGGYNDVSDLEITKIVLDVNTAWYYGKHDSADCARSGGHETCDALLIG